MGLAGVAKAECIVDSGIQSGYSFDSIARVGHGVVRGNDATAMPGRRRCRLMGRLRKP